MAAAADAEVAVIFCRTPGAVRERRLRPHHPCHAGKSESSIAAVAAVQPNTVVVLHNGSAIEMPWVNDVPAVLELYLPVTVPEKPP